jgi:hypothetical protein
MIIKRKIKVKEKEKKRKKENIYLFVVENKLPIYINDD